MNEPNQAHRTSSATLCPCVVPHLRGEHLARSARGVSPFDTRPRGKQKFLHDRRCIRPGTFLSSMSRSMRSSRTQNPHCCTALLTKHSAVLINVSGTMLVVPKPSLRRLVSPPRPYLAYPEALAPVEPARDAGLRLSGTTHHRSRRLRRAVRASGVQCPRKQPLECARKTDRSTWSDRELNFGKEALLPHVPGYRTVEAWW